MLCDVLLRVLPHDIMVACPRSSSHLIPNATTGIDEHAAADEKQQNDPVATSPQPELPLQFRCIEVESREKFDFGSQRGKHTDARRYAIRAAQRWVKGTPTASVVKGFFGGKTKCRYQNVR